MSRAQLLGRQVRSPVCAGCVEFALYEAVVRCYWNTWTTSSDPQVLDASKWSEKSLLPFSFHLVAGCGKVSVRYLLYSLYWYNRKLCCVSE